MEHLQIDHEPIGEVFGMGFHGMGAIGSIVVFGRIPCSFTTRGGNGAIHLGE